MENSRFQNGSVSQSRSAADHRGVSSSTVRMPTVNDALKYSPFVSVVPFNPDIIPAPRAIQNFSPSMFPNLEEEKAAKEALKQIGKSLDGATNASRRFQETLRDMQKFLDPNNLMQFKFSKPRRPQLKRYSNRVSSGNVLQLSPFADVVYRNTDVSYHYLSSQTSLSKPMSDLNGVGTPQLSSVKLEPSPGGTDVVSKPSQRSTEAKVVISNSLTPAQRAEYKQISEKSSSNEYEKPALPQQQNPGFRRMAYVSIDQKQKTDIAVKKLRSLLSEIFEAEDHQQGGLGDSENFTMFSRYDNEDGTVLSLQAEYLARLESHVQKVIANARLSDIDIDDLVHAQKLCEGAVSHVQAVYLAIEEDWSETDIEEWCAKLNKAETGLTAARTIMRIMAGAPQTKEVQSESFLQQSLDCLRNIIGGCILPLLQESAFTGDKVRGQKEGLQTNPKFTVASTHRKELQSLMNAATKAIRVVGELLAKTDFEETNIAAVEYLCRTLVFAENATVERESAIGIQNFETMRRSSMDVIAKIFTKYNEQRQSILDEILLSLEKLPATRQSARQYPLPEGKPIQLVSALLMRLIQTSATRTKEALKQRSRAQVSEESESDSDEDAEGSSDDEIRLTNSRDTDRDLKSIVAPLHDAARRHANHVVSFLISRAMTTSKSSDEPHRRLLDIFIEDFLNVLGAIDWPAAELLLLNMAMHMIRLIQNPKSAAPARTMALELLGTMGSGILEIQIATRNLAKTMDLESGTSGCLAILVDQVESGDLDTSVVLSLSGPYRVAVENLAGRGNNAQAQTARGYHFTDWASKLIDFLKSPPNSDRSEMGETLVNLPDTLRRMLIDPLWLSEHGQLAPASEPELRLAAKLLTLNSKFCRLLSVIFNTLLSSMNSEQPTVRSRSLKSVDTLLEKDPTILDRQSNILHAISRCSSDASPLVRDSALGLIAKCVSLRPSLDNSVYEQVITRTRDNAPGVRRRSMKILKDIYLRNNFLETRSAIASAVISRILDVDESVMEMARSIIEEIFFEPFYNINLDGDNAAVNAKVAYRFHAALLIQTLEQNDDVIRVFGALLKRLLNKSKAAVNNSKVCRTLIAVLFDGIIDSKDIEGEPSQDLILKTLTVFAKVCPRLFTALQLERLEPYLENLSTSDDLEIYRSSVTILRHAIPHQSLIKPEALTKMLNNLIRTTQKLPKSEMKDVLSEVAPCAWTINEMIGGNGQLVNLVKSALARVLSEREKDLKSDQPDVQKVADRIIRLTCIVGQFGKACDFGSHLSEWKKSHFPWYKGDTVPGLLVEVVCPFIASKWPLDVRTAALDAVSSISQAWPSEFLRPDVTTSFEIVFDQRVPELEEALLAGLEAFFCSRELSKDDEDNDGVPELGSGIASGKERLGRTYVASDEDSALTSLAQRFLPQIRRIALASCDDKAFIAARLIITINSQGLGHPKDSAPALVALETCPNANIAKKAFAAHRDQGLSRESVFEKEYMRSVQLAFEYQHRVFQDVNGFVGQPPVAKLQLLWEVLKAGKATVRHKFVNNMVQRLDFDIAKVKLQNVWFTLFCLENLAFFDFDKIDELLHLMSSLEKIFSGTGTVVAQAIESEVLKLQIDKLGDAKLAVSDPSDPDPMETNTEVIPSVDSQRLRQLTLSAQVLCLVWETRSFVRRLWMLQKYMGKPKKSAKDANRNAYRAPNATQLTEAYQKRASEITSDLLYEEDQRAMCNTFVQMMSIDEEVKVGKDEEGEEEMAIGYDEASGDESGKSPSQPPSGGGRSRKRKSSNAAHGVPRKKNRPSFSGRKSSSFRKLGEGDDEEEDDADGDWGE